MEVSLGVAGEGTQTAGCSRPVIRCIGEPAADIWR